MRQNQDPRVHRLHTPRAAPREPSPVQEPKILTVVAEEHPAVLGRRKELAEVASLLVAELTARCRSVVKSTQVVGDPDGNIVIEVEIHRGQAVLAAIRASKAALCRR